MSLSLARRNRNRQMIDICGVLTLSLLLGPCWLVGFPGGSTRRRRSFQRWDSQHWLPSTSSRRAWNASSEPLTNLDGFGKAPTKDSDNEETKKTATKKGAVAARSEAFKELAIAVDAQLRSARPPGAQAPDSQAPADKAAEAQAQVDRIRRNRALVGWGLASLLAMCACGAFGFRLMALTGFKTNEYVDVVITGLAVGSGTKPLHDLISNIQKAKDNSADKPVTP